MTKAARTIVYIDGFNLYYRCLKGTPYKWLDLKCMAACLLPSAQHDIVGVKYFTSRVSATPSDPGVATRQDAYLNAVKFYLGKDNIIEGRFMTHVESRPLAPPKNGIVKVLDTKEKGTDVNLAVHMLNDAWLDRYDCAVLVSNDSDLAESVRLVRERGKLVGWFMTDTQKPSKELDKVVTFKKPIRKGILAKSQLPDEIPGTNIHKPPVW